jgi:hypothetical protein
MKLTDLFDRVYIINCQHRPDRREALFNHLQSLELVDWDKVVWQRGIVGDYTGHPAYWKAGRGAWGCLQSHRRVLEDALHERDDYGCTLKSILVLEDDVVFAPDTATRLDDIASELPAQWGQLYLGGQHRGGRSPITTNLCVGSRVNRTHAYAVHRDCYAKMYHHISHAPDYMGAAVKHVDHQLELAHTRKDWLVLCANPWVAGQAAGSSNISGRINETQWWL